MTARVTVTLAIALAFVPVWTGTAGAQERRFCANYLRKDRARQGGCSRGLVAGRAAARPQSTRRVLKLNCRLPML